MRAPITPSPATLWCIVLAAGGSSRLGRPKQTVRYRQQPLLSNVVAAAAGVAHRRTIAVLGADSLRLRLLLRRGPRRSVRVVVNRRWRDGLASSLNAGLDALPPSAGAALILLVDQPRVRTSALARLVRAWRSHPKRAAAAAYAGRVGVPAILPRRLWSAARRLQGDIGARAVLATERNLTHVAMPEAALDIDTENDLRALT